MLIDVFVSFKCTQL